MNVLHLMPYSPIPPHFGGALRVYHLLQGLVRSHEVTVVSYGTPEDARRLTDEFGGRLKDVYMLPRPWPARHRRIGQFRALWTSHSFFSDLLRSDAMQRTISTLLDRSEFDVVQSEFYMMGLFRLNTAAVTILDSHNVEYDNFRRMWLNARSPLRRLHYYLEYQRVFAEEIEVSRKHDAILITSARDRAILDEHVPQVPKFVIPNGVDTAYFQPSPDTPEPYSLVFTGMMAYVPNYDGMLYFLDEIFPLIQKVVPEAKVYIVGKRPPKELIRRASDRVIVTGYVDDVRPFIRRASVYVVPLRMGSGTRLKVLEAMAMKKPIVTTTIGCEGIDVVHGESALIADDPQAFAHAVIELLHRADLRQTLTRNGYDLVRSAYEWSIIGEQVETVYQTLVRPVHAEPAVGVS